MSLCVVKCFGEAPALPFIAQGSWWMPESWLFLGFYFAHLFVCNKWIKARNDTICRLLRRRNKFCREKLKFCYSIWTISWWKILDYTVIIRSTDEWMKVQGFEYLTFLPQLCAQPYNLFPFTLQNCIHWSSVEQEVKKCNNNSQAKEQNILCYRYLDAYSEAWLHNT